MNDDMFVTYQDDEITEKGRRQSILQWESVDGSASEEVVSEKV
jgi:hypothetical protein